MTGPKQNLRDFVLQVAPCVGRDPALYDSIEYADHLKARSSCIGCPSRSACREIALADKSTGTFGGDLFRDGAVVMAIDT